jgi:sulfite reductase (NADPH) flavoprotein alpha-component
MSSSGPTSWLVTVATDRRFWLAGLVCVPVALYLRTARKASGESSTDFNVFLKVQPPPRPARRSRSQAEKNQATSFRAFLKEDVAVAQDSCDFSTFLRSNVTDKPAATPSLPMEQPKGPSDEQVKVPVFYGTEYGFSKEIAEKLCSMLDEAGSFWWVALVIL